jgi:hypothetical protein
LFVFIVNHGCYHCAGQRADVKPRVVANFASKNPPAWFDDGVNDLAKIGGEDSRATPRG